MNKGELDHLNRVVSMYLDYAEIQAIRNRAMYMKDWIHRLDSILQLNGRELLTHAGKISHQMALEKSSLEFEKFREEQKKLSLADSLNELENDIKQLENNNGKNRKGFPPA